MKDKADWTNFWVLLFLVVLGGMFLWANMIPEPRFGGDAQDPHLRKLQSFVRKVGQMKTPAECLAEVPSLHIAGGVVALHSDLTRYPKWLKAGQSYEVCFRSCPYAEKACKDADAAIYEADAWLRKNPKPSSPSRPRKKHRSR